MIQQNLRDDDPDECVGVLLAISGDQSDGTAGKPPGFGLVLEFAKFLIGERNERSRVIKPFLRGERFINGCLSDEGFPHAGRCGYQDTAFRFKPGQQGFFLKRI